MPAAPTRLQDVARDKYKQLRPDWTLRNKMESGLVKSRPRFSKVRRQYQCGLTNVNATDKATLDTFCNTVRDGADSFTWVDPTDNVTKTVRFAENGNIEWAYVGYNSSTGHIWDASFILEEV